MEWRTLKKMKLRAHHLLCLYGFYSGGYNKSFRKNIKNIQKKIKNNPNIRITIINKVDEICNFCPNKLHNKCIKRIKDMEKYIKKQDLDVLKRLNLKIGTIKSAKKLFPLVKEKIKGDDLKNICKGCEWLKFGTCIKAIEKRNLI